MDDWERQAVMDDVIATVSFVPCGKCSTNTVASEIKKTKMSVMIKCRFVCTFFHPFYHSMTC